MAYIYFLIHYGGDCLNYDFALNLHLRLLTKNNGYFKPLFTGGGSSKNLEHLIEYALEWEPTLKQVYKALDGEINSA